MFAKFSGNNCPEKHKHRKRALENLWSSDLRSHSLSLQDLLQVSWFQREYFKQLKQTTEGLMMSLNSYAEYLQENKLHHQLTVQPSPLCNDASHGKSYSKLISRLPCLIHQTRLSRTRKTSFDLSSTVVKSFTIHSR